MDPNTYVRDHCCIKQSSHVRFGQSGKILFGSSCQMFVSIQKAHFLKHPGQVLLSIYFFCVFGLGYSVFVCERASPTVQPIELEVFFSQIFARLIMITSEYGMVGGGVNNKSWFWWHCADITRRESLCWCCINSWGTWYYIETLMGARECFMTS